MGTQRLKLVAERFDGLAFYRRLTITTARVRLVIRGKA
jgi:hypothetical protein